PIFIVPIRGNSIAYANMRNAEQIVFQVGEYFFRVLPQIAKAQMIDQLQVSLLVDSGKQGKLRIRWPPLNKRSSRAIGDTASDRRSHTRRAYNRMGGATEWCKQLLQ